MSSIFLSWLIIFNQQCFKRKYQFQEIVFAKIFLWDWTALTNFSIDRYFKKNKSWFFSMSQIIASITHTCKSLFPILKFWHFNFYFIASLHFQTRGSSATIISQNDFKLDQLAHLIVACVSKMSKLTVRTRRLKKLLSQIFISSSRARSFSSSLSSRSSIFSSRSISSVLSSFIINVTILLDEKVVNNDLFISDNFQWSVFAANVIQRIIEKRESKSKITQENDMMTLSCYERTSNQQCEIVDEMKWKTMINVIKNWLREKRKNVTVSYSSEWCGLNPHQPTVTQAGVDYTVGFQKFNPTHFFWVTVVFLWVLIKSTLKKILVLSIVLLGTRGI